MAKFLAVKLLQQICDASNTGVEAIVVCDPTLEVKRQVSYVWNLISSMSLFYG